MDDDADGAGDGTDDAGTDSLHPTLEHVLDLDIEVADPIEVGETGDGLRRIIPITSGTVSGRIDGEILPGGADFQLFRVDRPTQLVARYAFETDAGDRVYVQNEGIRHASPEVKRRLRDGHPVDPADVYMQSTPRFETAAPDLAWLTQSVFVAGGTRQPNGVRLGVYRVA